MPSTDYYAQYFAYEATKRCASDSVERLAGAAAGEQVDLDLRKRWYDDSTTSPPTWIEWGEKE